VTVRREMRSLPRFIALPSQVLSKGTKQDRASSSRDGLFSFEGVAGYVTTNCADFAALQQPGF